MAIWRTRRGSDAGALRPCTFALASIERICTAGLSVCDVELGSHELPCRRNCPRLSEPKEYYLEYIIFGFVLGIADVTWPLGLNDQSALLAHEFLYTGLSASSNTAEPGELLKSFSFVPRPIIVTKNALRLPGAFADRRPRIKCFVASFLDAHLGRASVWKEGIPEATLNRRACGLVYNDGNRHLRKLRREGEQ